MATSTRTILITGSNGFTGKHLTALLAKDGATELYFADKKEPETSDSRFRLCDFSDSGAVQRLIAGVRPDKVYHLVGTFTNVYETDYTANVLSTKYLLDAILSVSLPCRVLLIGSSAEYGVPQNADTPVSETHPLVPVSIYGLTKVFQHTLMETYVAMYHMDIVMARTFNLLGKGISPVLLTGNIASQVEEYTRGERRKIETADLAGARDYIAVERAVEYYRAIMEKGKTGEVYNVGSGTSTPLRAVVSEVLAEKGLSMDIVTETASPVPGKIVVQRIVADIKKTDALIG
ncbi:MAG: NAD-dependent epimerase/dehydratase family protein [Candidatus Taylorbacteria bacterium]|nr:NAD-dependent epimerase/dehydratase family protein [Candidatus Taylorbacteria bacterium]